MPLDKPAPSPWLSVLGSAAITMGGLVWTAATRNSDLAYLQTRMDHVEARTAALETRANGVDVTVERINTELRYIRDDLGEIKKLLQGRTVKFVHE